MAHFTSLSVSLQSATCHNGSMPAGIHHVALIGLSGAGKSTVGRLLADELGLRLVDTDREIEHTARMPVHRIFSELGEPEFRRLEALEVRRALSGPRSVISLGGGAVANEASRQLLWERALVVWLRADPEILGARLSHDRHTEARPLLGSAPPAAGLRQLLARRQAYYEAAHMYVDTTDLSPEEVAAQIIAALGPRP